MRTHKNMTKMFLYIVVSLIFSIVVSQSFAAFQFGSYNMASHAGRISLRTSFSGSAGLKSLSFLGKNGGINFESTAFLDPKFKNDTVTLDYNLKNEDGKRLKIFIGNSFLSFLRYFGSFGEAIYKMIGNTIITPLIYDWQLKPITEYANSKYSGVVSLFGDGEDRENNFYIEYHPAFEDTVLGLRLFQADIMLINLDELAALPKKDGKLFLGKGEIEANTKSAAKAIEEVKSIIEISNVQSWVLTDVKYTENNRKDGRVSIDIDGQLKIDINPYYYFWKTNEEDRDKIAYIEFLLRTIENEIKETILANDNDKIIILNENKLKLETIKNEIKIIVVEEVIKKLKSSGLLSKINPAVFDAVNKTSKYSSLFRLVKKENISNWKDFVKEIDTIQIPKIDTPSIWKKY